MNYNDTRDSLKSIGIPVYPGCRVEAVKTAMEEFGIPLEEIISKFSDHSVLEAIEDSIRMYGWPEEEE